MTGNREYKSDVFSMLLEDPENALSLYNAMNDSDYTDPDMVEICTLDKGISLTVHNDASFVLDMHLSIYEHQSTICPNMPVRSLIYFTIILHDMLKNIPTWTSSGTLTTPVMSRGLWIVSRRSFLRIISLT